MKMSNVFELPVTTEIGYADNGGWYNAIVDAKMEEIIGEYDISMDDAVMIAQAINTHDKLIDLLKQAVGRVVISAADQDELQWFIEVMDVLEGEL